MVVFMTTGLSVFLLSTRRDPDAEEVRVSQNHRIIEDQTRDGPR
jgi:hypothetical protein